MKGGNVVYFTVRTPFGSGEEFVLNEMLSLLNSGASLIVCPRDTVAGFGNRSGARLADRSIRLPLISPSLALEFALTMVSRPLHLAKVVWPVLRNSRTALIAIKNFLLVPKALGLARTLGHRRVSHIHAHWGGTSSTLAYLVSKFIGDVNWSMTVHRWDIAEDNLLAFKVANATFTRCISKQGHAEVQARIRVADRGKVVVVHMGTPLPCIEAAVNAPHPIFTIITPANFVPKKGHIYLIQACALLVARGVRNFRCLLVGRGPLAKRLRDEIGKRKLGSFVRLVGQKPNEELREMYLSGSVDAVVLPSIVTEDGQYEGIPVSLMEAMAACLPVISTRTGAVDELVDPSCGKLVREKDPTALAEAILELMNEPGKAQALGVSARRKIEAEFDDEQIAQTLLAMFEHYAREPV